MNGEKRPGETLTASDFVSRRFHEIVKTLDTSQQTTVLSALHSASQAAKSEGNMQGYDEGYACGERDGRKNLLWYSGLAALLGIGLGSNIGGCLATHTVIEEVMSLQARGPRVIEVSSTEECPVCAEEDILEMESAP